MEFSLLFKKDCKRLQLPRSGDSRGGKAFCNSQNVAAIAPAQCNSLVNPPKVNGKLEMLKTQQKSDQNVNWESKVTKLKYAR